MKLGLPLLAAVAAVAVVSNPDREKLVALVGDPRGLAPDRSANRIGLPLAEELDERLVRQPSSHK